MGEVMADMRYTIQDVDKMSGHAELVNGCLVIEDRTSPRHNMMVNEIAGTLKNYIATHGNDCFVFTENVALYCPEAGMGEDNYFLPDVMVVCKKESISDDGVHGVPVFVAEVTSVATKKNDYTDKMIAYRNMGVVEYWIIDLQRDCLCRYLLANDYVPDIVIHPQLMQFAVYPDLTMELDINVND